MKKGGIAIRDLEKLTGNKSFHDACERFKSRLNGEDEARKHAGLTNLDAYRDESRHSDFAARVEDALAFIGRRKLNRALRKAGRTEGVSLLYDDETCFIVSPDGPKSSHKAAYLDNGTANWCIAVPDAKKAEETWSSLDIATVFYIYRKGGESWALVVDWCDAVSLHLSPTATTFPSLIENRQNNIGRERDKIAAEYARMLSTTALSDDAMRKIAQNAVPSKLPKGFIQDHLSKYLATALERGNNHLFFHLLSKASPEALQDHDISHLASNACYAGNLEALKGLIDLFSLKRCDPLGFLIFCAAEDICCFRHLLDLGVDVSRTNPDGFTIMEYVLSNWQTDCTRELISRGLDPHKAVERLHGIFWNKATDENIAHLNFLDSLNMEISKEELMLGVCSYSCTSDRTWPRASGVLRHLLESGFRYDPNPSRSPLGKDGTITDYNPLALLFKKRALFEFQFGRLRDKAQRDFAECVKMALELGAPVDGFIHKGWTLLNEAVATDDPEVVEMMLRAGTKAGQPIRKTTGIEITDNGESKFKKLNPKIESLLSAYGIPMEN